MSEIAAAFHSGRPVRTRAVGARGDARGAAPTSRRSPLFGPAARYQGARAGEGFERTGVGPPAAQHFVGHAARRDVAIVDVGDLELAAAGGLELANVVEHRRVIEVDARDRVGARGTPRLFDDASDAGTP